MSKEVLVQQKKIRKKLSCPVCGSAETYYRLSDEKMICYRCGNAWERPDLE